MRDPTGGNFKGTRIFFAKVDCAELLVFGADRFLVLFVFDVVRDVFRESELRAVL
jgi:hypothetical protein